MNYYVYGNHHRLCLDLTICNQEFDKELIDFCVSRNLRESDGVACAYYNGTLAGFFRFDIDAVDGTMYTNGTYILPNHRGMGVAPELWGRAFRKRKPAKVVAVVTSQGGEKLITKMKRFYPNIRFCESVQI